jgi:hypothetical protein
MIMDEELTIGSKSPYNLLRREKMKDPKRVPAPSLILKIQLTPPSI